MSATFLKLISGSRLTNYMGLQMDPGTEFRNGSKYKYIEIPIAHVELDGEKVDAIKRNQHVWIASAASVDVKGEQIIEVEPNRELAALGQLQASYRIHPGSGPQRAGMWFTARKDVDISTLTHAVRIYMYE